MSAKYYRVRVKYRNDETELAWNLGEVGIWYGAWSASDLEVARVMSTNDAAKFLSGVQRQFVSAHPNLDWDISESTVHTARRFKGITSEDWVIVFFTDTLHFAQVMGDVNSDANHPLNKSGEVFKYRKIKRVKSFRLSRLPDSYRLIPSAGRANVHEYNGTNWELVSLLAESPDENAVREKILKMTLRERLNILGPTGWESLCLGYLILEEGFLPTGLRSGGTLQNVDIVGCNLDGKRIVAQCKKTNYPVEIDDEFLETCQNMDGKTFYFAYKGCLNPPPWVNVITIDDIENWERGKDYLELFFATNIRP